MTKKLFGVALISALLTLESCSLLSQTSPADKRTLKSFATNQLFATTPPDAVVSENYSAGRTRDLPSGHIGGYTQKRYLTPKTPALAFDELLQSVVHAGGVIETVTCEPPYGYQPATVGITAVMNFEGTLYRIAAGVQPMNELAASLIRIVKPTLTESAIGAFKSNVDVAVSLDSHSPIAIPTSVRAECNVDDLSDQHFRQVTGYAGPINRQPAPYIDDPVRTTTTPV